MKYGKGPDRASEVIYVRLTPRLREYVLSLRTVEMPTMSAVIRQIVKEAAEHAHA